MYARLEREKIEQINVNNKNGVFTVKIKELTKIYKSFCRKSVTAVNNLYLALEPNQKFGLMGFNGSGKTTTFKSITDEILFERGKIHLFEIDTETNFETIRKDIGYCPQAHALFDYLSVTETIRFYMKLKKVTDSISVDFFLSKFGLYKFKNTICNNLSGGNKRKLNFAIALMSHPRLILLDEPSTGVDAESRRIMWKNINDIPKYTECFNMILSTHSMEEAEILCDSIGWMKNGNFVCVGNPEKLKLQFSQGYHFNIKFLVEKTKTNIKTCALRINSKTDKKHDSLLYIGFDPNEYINNDNHYLAEYTCLFEKLHYVISVIRPLSDTIKIMPIDPDNIGAFQLIIKVDSNIQGNLFYNILKLKTIDSDIIEINLNMEPLENILTSL